MQNVTSPVSLPFTYFMQDIPLLLDSNTSSFLTWSVQLIFSILLQHHISKLSRCFWSTVRIVQVIYSHIMNTEAGGTSETSNTLTVSHTKRY